VDIVLMKILRIDERNGSKNRSRLERKHEKEVVKKNKDR